jgi:soluble lytic murein transglycosylase-like protein
VRTKTLVVLFLFWMLWPPMRYSFAQDIVRYVGSDGKRVYSNTESIYQLPGNVVSSSEVMKTVNQVSEFQASQKVENLIQQISERHGMDPDLVKAVAKVESNYNPYAVSRRGAMGLMQLLPDTAKRFGVSNIFDTKQNIEGGVKFLKFLMEMFPNNPTRILAAYNAGEKAVLKYGGIPPYRETREYVRKITALYGKKSPFETARVEPEGTIVRYRDEAGRVVYSNVESAYR